MSCPSRSSPSSRRGNASAPRVRSFPDRTDLGDHDGRTADPANPTVPQYRRRVRPAGGMRSPRGPGGTPCANPRCLADGHVLPSHAIASRSSSQVRPAAQPEPPAFLLRRLVETADSSGDIDKETPSCPTCSTHTPRHSSTWRSPSAALGIVAASLLLGRSREAEAVARPSGHSLTPHERTRRHR